MTAAQFRGLLYRELLLNKKDYINGILTFFGTALFALSITLSFKFGNLALLPDEAKLFADSTIELMTILPVVSAYSFMTSGAVVRDMKPVCNNFRMSTPISGWQFSSVRYAIKLVMLALTLGFNSLYLAINCALSGEAFKTEMFKLMLVIVTFCLVFVVLSEVLAILLKSMERAMITMATAMMAGVFCVAIYSSQNRSTMSDEPTIQMAYTLAEKALPYLPFVIIGVMLIGWVGTALLLKRREK